MRRVWEAVRARAGLPNVSPPIGDLRPVRGLRSSGDPGRLPGVHDVSRATRKRRQRRERQRAAQAPREAEPTPDTHGTPSPEDGGVRVGPAASSAEAPTRRIPDPPELRRRRRAARAALADRRARSACELCGVGVVPPFGGPLLCPEHDTPLGRAVRAAHAAFASEGPP